MDKSYEFGKDQEQIILNNEMNRQNHNKWPSGDQFGQPKAFGMHKKDGNGLNGTLSKPNQSIKTEEAVNGGNGSLFQNQYNMRGLNGSHNNEHEYTEDAELNDKPAQNADSNGNGFNNRTPAPDDNTSDATSDIGYRGKNHTEYEGHSIGSKHRGIIEEQNIKCSVELKNGVPQRSMISHKNSNALTLNNYNGIVGFFIFLNDLLFIADHGILSIQWFVMYFSGAFNEIGAYSYIIAVTVVSLFTRGLINYLHDKKLKQSADIVNQKPVEKFVFNKRRKSFQLLNWASIQTGDVIKVKQNQEIPCDALILDIVGSKSVNQTCNMRGGLWDDFRNPTPKCSYQGTMNKTGQHISDSKFVDQISGLLKWEYNHFGFFTGSFKQIDSPAAFDITTDNILQRGCYFTQAHTVICLVLNVGNMTMGNNFRQDESREGRVKHFFRSKKNGKNFESPYFQTLKVLQIFAFLFCFVPVIIMILEDLVLHNLAINKWIATWGLKQEQDSITGFGRQKYYQAFAGFMQNLPYLAKLTMESVIYFHAYFTMWDINLVPASIKFNDLKVMRYMGQVDSIVCSKSAFFSSGHTFTTSFKICNQLYRNQKTHYNECSHKNNRSNQNSAGQYNSGNSMNSASDSSDEETPEQMEYLPNHLYFDPFFDCPQAQELISKKQHTSEMKNLKTQFEEFLTAMVLCHHAVLPSKPNMREEHANRQNYKCLYKEEESQLQFAESFDYQIMSRRKRLLNILKRGVQETYNEIIIRRITIGTETITIQAVKLLPFNSNVTIFYKGRMSILKDFLTKEIQKSCNQDIEKFTQQGIHVFGICKCELDSENSSDFVNSIHEISGSYKGQANKNDKLLMQYASDPSNLQLIGTWGNKKVVNARDTLVIEELKKNGVKLFMLSQDETTSNLTDCNALDIFEEYGQPLLVTGHTDRHVEESLKTNLKQVVERRTQKTPTSNIANQYPVNRKTKVRGGGKERTMKTSQVPTAGAKEKRDVKKVEGREKAKRVSSPAEKPSDFSDFSDSSKFAERNVVFIDGKALQFILKDETLLKLFLTLCSLSSLCIGSSINPYQKVMLVRAIKQFCHSGNQGTVISVIASQSDKFTIQEADISIGLITLYKQSDILAQADIQMKNIFGLTYLLFKHGTLAYRRTKVVLDEFIYRTILTMSVQIFLFVFCGFSFVLPYGKFFFPFFMAFLTPVQFWLEGISYTDYGYSIFHRIFGEYRHNQTQKLQFWSYAGVIFTAIADAFIFCLFYIITNFNNMDLQVTTDNAQVVSWQSYVVLNGILLSMMHIARARAIRNSIQIFNLSNFLFFLFSLAFVLEDENLAGVQMLFSSVNVLAFITFTGIYLILRIFVKLVIQVALPWNFKNLERYIAIEDRLFMEEYENPEQQFCIHNLNNYQSLIKTLDSATMFSINQNLLKVHRTDSMDQIIDRLNAASGQITNASGYINKFTLKLNDINKEMEYNQNINSNKQVEHCIPMLWTSVFMYFTLCLFKMINTIMEKNVKDNSGVTDEDEFVDGESNVHDKVKTNQPDDLSPTISGGITLSTVYFEITMIFAILVSIYLIRKVRSNKSHIIIYSLIVLMNLQVIVQFFIDQDNPLIKIEFVYTLAFSFGCRLSSFFFVSAVCIFSSVTFMNINLESIQKDIDADTQNMMIHQIWQTIAIITYIFQWVYYSYGDEIKRKIQFVTQYRKVKEFQKLKAIINILIPSLVRSRIQEGKKNFSEAQGEVTIIFIDIEGFDKIVQTYNGRELVDLLDKTYNAFDQLCEQYGIQKIETVGKTYMACGGLKLCERDIDSRLLGSHHSVRVVDFACIVQQYASTVTLKNGEKLSVKIGVHTGDVISGVVGETKPQFSLIGDTVNKSSRVCSKCPKNKILISKETHEALAGNSNNFHFGQMEVPMKGITKQNSKETVYTVCKRRTVSQRILAAAGANRNTINKNKVLNANRTQVGKNQMATSGKLNHHNKRVSSKMMQGYNNGYFDDQQNYNNGEFSQRSINDDTYGVHTERKIMMQDESEQIDDSLNDSFDDDGPNNMKYSDFKEDRQIVKSAAQNERYKLVERPRFLLQLEMKEQEQKFFTTQWNRNLKQEIASFFFKCIFDIMIVQCIIYIANKKIVAEFNITVGCIHCIIVCILTILLYRARSKDISTVMFFHVLSYVVSIALLVAIAPWYAKNFESGRNENSDLMKSQQFSLLLYVMTIFSSKGISFRIFCKITLIMFFTLIIQNYYYVANKTMFLQTYIIDGLLNIILAVFFIISSYNREMKSRKVYNHERIIEVEIEKTEELLSKLVPQHVLQGIKNDQKVVDLLDNVTLLYTDMVGFTEFSNNVQKPQEVVTLLSRLFSKFDELCYQRKVYKVHTIGDCYVIMGYTGKIAKERRTLAVQIEEAYKVVQVGLEMIEIINDEREKSDNPLLKNLDMRIGIHSGRIVGGIIGTKVVRYDIFGSDVLIANKMESNGQAGSVVISETTHELLKKNQWIFDTFDMQEHRDVDIEMIGKSIKSYKIEQIFAANYTSSEDEEGLAQEDDHEEEEDELENIEDDVGLQDIPEEAEPMIFSDE